VKLVVFFASHNYGWIPSDNLSETDQRALFFAHLSEDRMSDGKIYDYLQGKVGPEKLYEFHHYKGKPTKETKKRMKERFRNPY